MMYFLTGYKKETGMKFTDIKVGKLVDFPIEVWSDGRIIFNEILTRNKYIADLTILVGARGEAKEKLQTRSVKGTILASYEMQDSDIVLRARKTSVGMFIYGFRINKIHKNLKICSAETFFIMYDGHFDEGKELQYNLFQPVLNLIERIQRFQFTV